MTSCETSCVASCVTSRSAVVVAPGADGDPGSGPPAGGGGTRRDASVRKASDVVTVIGFPPGVGLLVCSGREDKVAECFDPGPG
ncbi:hypothetical protein GCM10018782_32290 [Streptomyces griseoaurantiacus]|nr:hypothetical protein GCM10018782_32290 [Streptomyces griseoaurantiacus]